YGGMPYRVAFGRGLAKGACNLRVGWQQLVEQVEVQSEINKDFAVFAGFIEEVDSIDPVLAQELLDQCSQHPELRQVLVGLHPRQKFTDSDLDRCMALLDAPDIRPFMYGPILWKEQYAHLPKGRVLDLAQRLLKKPNGDDVILEALSLRLHNKDKAVDTLGCDLRQTGLKAATLRFYRNDSDRGGSTDYKMERVVDAALRFGGNEVEKQLWLDTIFSVVDKHYGYINTFENTIGTTAALVPEAFLNRIFEGSEEQQQRRLFFIRHGGLRRLPLSKINADVLIEWCRNKSDPGAWSTIASGIGLWPKNMNQQDGINLWDAALRFLENSPEPKAVLESFSEQVRPSSWSGSLANVMQSRADVIGKLVEHERTDISGAARAVYAELTKLIEREKVREQREDEEREQRFE
ncbi:hypothetical protein HW679_004923, partial [Salmonella enterica]|nr:hypothetical protein [Salmonella enterica]